MGSLESNERICDGSSVAGAARWRRAFVVVFVVQLLIKFVLVMHLPLFGDEAFYWQESRHLAWGYSDLPGMTAWLIALGTYLGADTAAVRSVFLVLGSSLPWLVVMFARRHFDARSAWQAGLLAMGLPLAGSLGVLALPDVMLTVASMLALLGLDAALSDNRWRHWLLLALGLILALASHYRAGMLLLAGLVFAVASPRGRALWRNRRWYLALALGAMGALPALIYNVGHHWAGLAFQAVDRNPWTFHADTLVQPLEQLLVCTPLLYLLLVWAVLYSLGKSRRCRAPWDLIASVAATFMLGYFLLGLFADDQRFRLHWPLAGYLPLLATVPLLARRLWHAGTARMAGRAVVLLAWVFLALGQVATLAYLGALSLPPDKAPWLRQHALANTFDGWRQATRVASSLLQQPAHADAVLVADNFRLAAELDFGLDGRRRVYSLDSPLNGKHGRALQLSDWDRDETALFVAHTGQPVLLVVEETALRERQRPAWLETLCTRFSAIEPLERIDISRKKRIAFYQARLRHAPQRVPGNQGNCVIWQRAYAAYQSASGSD